MTTAAREEQVLEVIKRFLASFESDIADDESLSAFKSIFDPDIEWQDHAFHVRRVGWQAILGLQKSFRHCNQPFNAKLKAVHPTPSGAVLEQLWIGRSTNDIIRPDGAIAVKASGKEFKCHVCMVMEISSEGRIVKIDEYYNKRWDDGVEESAYVVMKGASLKE